ncbi:3'-5' exonuclease [Paenibacillus glycanilyticus]|uniref:3'-5' exonuclease n=1 Tax=Paenibacillus glycanilyticus TaxID=126569 RepID=UPI00203D448D|nr:3'-5' exonuclease [Paenibacillus glycanilyticus]MCM3625747.1 3'-5' exonuclease [Paenibacillus glycanilyticus]
MKIINISDTEYSIEGLSVSHLLSKRYCAFDLEATGPNQDEEHITQMGAVIIENNQIVINKSFNSLVKSPKQIPQLIEKLTGIKNDEMKRAPVFSSVYQRFIEFINGCVLVTQAGYEFDYPLLNKECQRNNLLMFDNVALDTKVLFSFLHPEVQERITTNYLIDFYNINDSDIKRHDALGDSVLIARIFIKLLEELKVRNINEVIIDEPIIIKKVQLSPLT